MLSMEIFSLLLFTLTVAAAQLQPRNPGFRNPGFRNVRTPLATAASKDKPFISIPIVLLPNGQPVPKPRHTTYHYIGHATQNGQRQQNQRNSKQRGSVVGKSTTNYQVAILPNGSSSQNKKNTKPPKLSSQQLNSHLRNTQSNFPRGRGQAQNAQQNQPHKGMQQQFEQNPQVQQIQFHVKQQRNPVYHQQSSAPSQQFVSAHKQNVANFVNFATNLGSSVTSQHQTQQQIILPTQSPTGTAAFQNIQQHKTQESYTNQRPLLANHKLNSGVTFQHQVPSLQNAQVQYTQVLQNNVGNQNTEHASRQQHQSQPQQQLQVQGSSSSYQTPQQQNYQMQQQSNHQMQQQSNHQMQQQSNPQMQQQSNPQIQQQLPSSHSQQQLSNTQPQQHLRNSYSQQALQSTQSSSTGAGGSYLSTTNVRPNTQHIQGSEISSSESQQTNPLNSFQQNSGAHVRTQTNPNNLILLNGYNSQLQQGNQQNYAVPSPQQSTAVPQVDTYDHQSQLPKTDLSSQQPASTSSNTLDTQAVQTPYISQNQAQENYNLNSQGQQFTFPSAFQTPSGFPLDQIAEINTFALQNAHTIGQISNPLTYFHYQTAQDFPLSYASLFNQAQSGYITSPNEQQSDSLTSNLDQTYSILPSDQNVFSSSGQSVYTNSQGDNLPNSSPSDSGLQTYSSYENEQSAYTSPTDSQTGQESFISTPNTEKSYQGTQYNIQNSPETQSSQSSENQYSQSSSSVGNGPLIYASSSAKQINYTPSSSSTSSVSTTNSQQYGSSNYQSSPTYVAFTASSDSFKSDSPAAVSYGQRPSGIVTPGSTYAKANQNDSKQSESSSGTSEASEDSEYENEEEEDEEASYKVVYIPLDILKNILSNSVENQ